MPKWIKIIWWVFLGLWFVGSLIGVNPELEDAVNWLGDIDLWILRNAAYPGLFTVWIGLFLATLVFWLGPIAARIFLFGKRYDQFNNEFDSLSKEREDLWLLLGNAFDIWNEKSSKTDINLETVIDFASIPEGLIGNRDSISYYSTVELQNRVHHQSATLLDFLSEVYGEVVRYPQITDEAILTDASGNKLKFPKYLKLADRQRLHECRRAMSKFWNRWADRIYSKPPQLTQRRIRDQLHQQTRMLKLLTFMELVQAQWNHDPGRGKRQLFRLAATQDPEGDDSERKNNIQQIAGIQNGQRQISQS